MKRRKEKLEGLGRFAAAAWIGVAGAGVLAFGASNVAAKTPSYDVRDVPTISELRGRVSRVGQRGGRVETSELINREVSRAARYNRLFVEAGLRRGVDPRLLYAICRSESRFNPRAKSGAGAEGLMQFMPDTARRFGINPWDEAQAIDGAARYLRVLLDRFDGDMAAAVAAYNAGEQAVAAWREGFSFRNSKGRLINARRIRMADGLPPYSETREYVRAVSATWRYTNWTREFGPEVSARLGDPRFVNPRGAARSQVARVVRESVDRASSGGELPAGAVEKESETARPEVVKRAVGNDSRFYVGSGVVEAKASNQGGASEAAKESATQSSQNVSKAAAGEGARRSATTSSGQIFTDNFSGVRFIKADEGGIKPAVSRTSVYLGGE